jgi:23S rRNA pseudouridine1911/1915/1917 synthase
MALVAARVALRIPGQSPGSCSMNPSDPEKPADPAEPETNVTFTASVQTAGQRLDAYLASQISGWSRARLQRLIEDEDVLVNGQPVKAAYKLRAKDEIEVELTPAPTAEFTAENIPLNIVYEDDSLVMIDKPAGLVVHPGAGVSSGTLANGLAFHFSHLPTQAGKFRPGIVHRLDRGTSGLLVVAKTEAAHEHLAEQFRTRTVFKSYIALVHGSVKRDTDRIDQPITRDPRNRRRMAVGRKGRTALSLYRVSKRYERFTLLQVELKTGRTHQIRVHLAWLKHPIVGDETYGGGRDKTVLDPRLRAQIRKLNRQFLHAERLGFIHPKTQTPMQFSAHLPSELAALLAYLEE